MALIGTKVESFRFKDLDLSGAIVSFNDRIAIRLASHEYLKRDGGEIEPMGAAQGRFSMRCVFMGPNVTTRYRGLVNSLRQEPRGILVHPRLGKINVGCEGIEVSESPAEAIDTIEFSISFIEDAVDATILIDNIPGPQQRAGQVLNSNAKLSAAVTANFAITQASAVMARVVTATSVLTSASAAFVNAALLAAQNTSPDLSLLPLLGNVLAQQNALLAALSASRAFTLSPDALLTPYRIETRAIYAGSVLLYTAIIADKPPVVVYTVPTAMPLGQLLVALYGLQAKARLPEVMLLNRIQTPHWIPTGRQLLISQPQVRQ